MATMNRFYFCFILLFCLQISWAQRGTQPKEEDVSRAKALSEEYEDNELVALRSDLDIVFSYSNKLKQLVAEESQREKLMCIKGDCTHYVYEFYDDESEIKDIKATYRNGKTKPVDVQREYYSQDGIFFSDARVCYFELDFPAQGYQYEVKMKKVYENIKYFTSVYFSESYPLEQRKVSFTIPRWMKIELKEMNFEGFDIKKTTTYNSKQDADITTYLLKKIPGLKSERNSRGPSYLYPHVLILSKEYTYKDQTVTLFNSTKDLYDWYRSLVKNIENDPAVLKEVVAELTTSDQSDEEKIKAIYYWIQDNVRYIAFEDGIAGFKPESCQKVLKNKYGDCKGMANLTKQMLKLAGFDARLTWIGTKRLAYDYSLPSLAVDNHMICSVVLDGKRYFLDATEEFNQLGEYAERIQNQQVLIEDGDNYILERVPAAKASDNTMLVKSKLRIEGDVLVGSGAYHFNGESKARFMYNLNNIKSNHREEALRYYLNEDNKSYKVENVESSDINKRDGEISLKYDLKWENAVSAYDDELYVDIDFSKEFQHSVFKEERKQDYLFSHKISRKTIVELEIPDGYQASFLPENLEKNHADFSFKINFEVEGNTLRYLKEITVHNAEVKKENFETWNEFIGELANSYEQQIVLKKKS